LVRGGLGFKIKDPKIVFSGEALLIVGCSIIIHADEDNDTNTPVNGGSGAQVGCGIIELR
jgi:Cu/Zn superoxide dismutase